MGDGTKDRGGSARYGEVPYESRVDRAETAIRNGASGNPAPRTLYLPRGTPPPSQTPRRRRDPRGATTLGPMPYPEPLVTPMREELTRLGVEELRTAEAVDAAMSTAQEGTTLAIVNSVCGCAAANARPAVALVQRTEPQPDRYVTVFAGQDLDATARLREHLAGVPPSSPFMALFRDGDPVFVLERRHIEGRSASAIAQDLAAAFGRHCGADAPPADDAVERPDTQPAPAAGGLPPTFRSIL